MYAYAVTALVAATFAAAGTWQIQDWRFGAKEKERLEQQRREEFRRQEIADRAAVRHEKDKVRIETKYVQVVKEVPREIEKPVYRNVCISPDGVRNINDLIDTYDASEPARAMPEAGAATERSGE